MCNACQGNFYDVIDDDVCDYHAKWFVTMCKECNRYCISFVKGTCTVCLAKQPKTKRGIGFNRDHRASLRRNGLE